MPSQGAAIMTAPVLSAQATGAVTLIGVQNESDCGTLRRLFWPVAADRKATACGARRARSRRSSGLFHLCHRNK
jgi:hypothetical protein